MTESPPVSAYKPHALSRRLAVAISVDDLWEMVVRKFDIPGKESLTSVMQQSMITAIDYHPTQAALSIHMITDSEDVPVAESKQVIHQMVFLEPKAKLAMDAMRGHDGGE